MHLFEEYRFAHACSHQRHGCWMVVCNTSHGVGSCTQGQKSYARRQLVRPYCITSNTLSHTSFFSVSEIMGTLCSQEKYPRVENLDQDIWGLDLAGLTCHCPTFPFLPPLILRWFSQRWRGKIEGFDGLPVPFPLLPACHTPLPCHLPHHSAFASVLY